MAISKTDRQRFSELTAGYFALSMLALMAIFVIIHWADVALQAKSRTSNGVVMRIFRKTRSLLLRKIPGFKSIGHLLIFIVYLGINIGLSLWSLDWSIYNNWAKRLGWISTCNIGLITFLALKNTPLAFLTSYSYDRLNILHQAAGFCTIGFTVVHAIVYTVALYYSNSLRKTLLEEEQIVGMVAGISMMAILFSALFLRKMRYEVFYVLHIFFFLVIIIMVCMHRPNLATKSLYIVFFTGAVWVLDRVLRSTKVIANFFGNEATLTPLAHGGVSIVLKRTPLFAKPGSHLFLWLPGVRKAETHPFTIVSTNPTELVVNSHDGFTKNLLQIAEKEPGKQLRVSVDGPYGTMPDFMAFERVVLVAGGSGASFTFGVANAMLAQLAKKNGKMPLVRFVWVVREFEHLNWYSNHLAAIRDCPNMQLEIHVTRSSKHSAQSTSPADSTEAIEKSPVTSSPTELTSNEKRGPYDVEKSARRSLSWPSELNIPRDLAILDGRPQVSSVISAQIAGSSAQEKTIIAACGPNGMMEEVRRTVATEVGKGERSIRLHCEQFGW